MLPARRARLERPIPQDGMVACIALNRSDTPSLSNEQKGIAQLCRGLFQAFRSPSSHSVRVANQRLKYGRTNISGCIRIAVRFDRDVLERDYGQALPRKHIDAR